MDLAIFVSMKAASSRRCVCTASGSHLEVSSELLCLAYPDVRTMVGMDVCLLHEAYPDVPLLREGSVGWRAEVGGQRFDRGRRHGAGGRRTISHVPLAVRARSRCPHP